MRIKKMLGMGWGALRANLWGRKVPLNVMLSLTNRCLSHCSYCNIPSRSQKELSTTQVFSLIDQISRLNCERLGLWGGEPLLREDIGRIIDYAKKKKLFVTLDSNGYLLPQKLKLLKNLDHLILALDGDEKAHDFNREPGSFQKVMDAIETASGRIPFWTITVLTKHNLDSIDFIIAKAREYGFLSTFQLLHHNDILSGSYQNLFPSDGAYRKVIKKLISEKQKGSPIASSLSYLCHILKWPDYRQPNFPYRINNLRCWAGRLYCNVDTDGTVYPCSLLIGKTSALNFRDAGFKKAFEFMPLEICKGCLASCFTEYNYLYSLHAATIWEWFSSFRKTNKYLCKKKV